MTIAQPGDEPGDPSRAEETPTTGTGHDEARDDDSCIAVAVVPAEGVE